MAATKNTLSALWGKKLQDDRKTKSSDHGSVISTRSRAPEDKGAQEKEATSRLSKPEGEQASRPTDPPKTGKTADADAQVRIPVPMQAFTFEHLHRVVLFTVRQPAALNIDVCIVMDLQT